MLDLSDLSVLPQPSAPRRDPTPIVFRRRVTDDVLDTMQRDFAALGATWARVPERSPSAGTVLF